MLKIFKHTGAGHYIGSCVIVVCEDLETATGMIKDILFSNGLHYEVPDVTEIEIKNKTIVHVNNGDY